MTTMAEWVKAHKGELTRISAETGVPVARFYEAAKDGAKTTRHARSLSSATGGAVSVASLLGLTAEEAAAALDIGDTAPLGSLESIVPTDEEKACVATHEAGEDAA